MTKIVESGASRSGGAEEFEAGGLPGEGLGLRRMVVYWVSVTTTVESINASEVGIAEKLAPELCDRDGSGWACSGSLGSVPLEPGAGKSNPGILPLAEGATLTLLADVVGIMAAEESRVDRVPDSSGEYVNVGKLRLVPFSLAATDVVNTPEVLEASDGISFGDVASDLGDSLGNEDELASGVGVGFVAMSDVDRMV